MTNSLNTIKVEINVEDVTDEECTYLTLRFGKEILDGSVIDVQIFPEDFRTFKFGTYNKIELMVCPDNNSKLRFFKQFLYYEQYIRNEPTISYTQV